MARGCQMQRVTRIFAWLILVAALFLSGFLIFVAQDEGPTPRLVFDTSSIPSPGDIDPAEYLDVNALCESFDPDGVTTVEIMQQIRGPVVRGLVSLIRNEITPWSAKEVATLDGHLNDLFEAKGFNGSAIGVISRSGGANVDYLKAIENASLRADDMISQCEIPGPLRYPDESLYDCIDRHWGGGQEAFAYTHTGFLLRSATGKFKVLHAYPRNGHLDYFCEPLSHFFGVPLDARRAMVMVPNSDEQQRLRRALEGPLSVQIRRMRYSLTSPPEAPNYTNSNGFTFQAVLASGLAEPHDVRESEAVVAQSAFKPSIILFGHTFIGRLLDALIPALDLSTQPYAKQGVFETVTPLSLFHHVSKRGWTIADIDMAGWRLREAPALPVKAVESSENISNN